MLNRITHRNCYLLGLILIAAGLTLSPALMSIGQGLLLVNWIWEGSFKAKAEQVRSNKALLAFLLIIGIHLAGLVYTTNFAYALKDLKIKLPILLLPLIIATTEQLRVKELRLVLNCLLICVLASSIYSLSIYLSIEDIYNNELRNISPIISHIRFSLIACVCFFVCIYFVTHSDKKIYSAGNLLYAGLAAWFFIFIGILGARAGYLSVFVALAFIILYKIIQSKRWYLILILLAGMVIVPVMMYHLSSSVRTRVNEAEFEMNNYRQGGDPSGHSVAQRFEYWKGALTIFKAHPVIGVGTGDIDDAFRDYYNTYDNPLQKEWQFRAHNQYLTMLATFGLTGFLLFLFALLYPYYRSDKRTNLLFVTFLLILLLSMLTEDTLETQAGATFFAFFYSLFLFGQVSDRPVSSAQAKIAS